VDHPGAAALTGEGNRLSDDFRLGCLIAYAASGVRSGRADPYRLLAVLNRRPTFDRARVSLACVTSSTAVVAYRPAAVRSLRLLERLLAAARPVRKRPPARGFPCPASPVAARPTLPFREAGFVD